jgi:hypothetical protein
MMLISLFLFHKQWESRGAQFEAFIKHLTLPFEKLPNFGTVTPDTLTSQGTLNFVFSSYSSLSEEKS